VRYPAADTLGEMGPAAEAVIPSLIEAKLLSDKTGDFNPYARALVWVGPVAIPPVVAVIETEAGRLPSDEIRVRRRAASPVPDGENRGCQPRWRSPAWYQFMHVLWMIGEPAIPSLTRLMTNPSPDLRSFATRIISSVCDDAGQIIEAARPALVRALSDSHPEIWQPAALALARRLLEPRAVVPALVLLRDEMEAKKTPDGEYPDVEMLDWIKDTLRRYKESKPDNKY
jgi:hypothetical protein